MITLRVGRDEQAEAITVHELYLVQSSGFFQNVMTPGPVQARNDRHYLNLPDDTTVNVLAYVNWCHASLSLGDFPEDDGLGACNEKGVYQSHACLLQNVYVALINPYIFGVQKEGKAAKVLLLELLTRQLHDAKLQQQAASSKANCTATGNV
jgi:hypothetical protein